MDEDYEVDDLSVENYGGGDEDSDSDENFYISGPAGEGLELKDAIQEPNSTIIHRSEQVHMIHLRHDIDNLANHVNQKDQHVKKTREELRTCREQIRQLQEEQVLVSTQITALEESNNVSTVSRLHDQQLRLREELANEQEIEKQIQAQLDQAEYDLANAQVEQGKLILADSDLKEKEMIWRSQRYEQAAERSKKENAYARSSEKQREKLERQQKFALETRERRREYTLHEAQRSQEHHNKFLKQTLSKLQQREKEEEERVKAHMEERVNTMLTLKANIAANRENLRALQDRDKAMSLKAKKKKVPTATLR